AYSRVVLRLEECYESLKIIEQCADRLEQLEGAPVMVADKKIAWPAQLPIGAGGQGNSFEHVRHIMGESMEALIHHFKLVTEGFPVPAGQAYAAVENPKGFLGVHVVSDGAPSRGARTSATRASTTCRRSPRSPKAARWPTWWSRSPRSTWFWEAST